MRGAVAMTEPLLRHEGRAEPAALGDRQLPGGLRRRSTIAAVVGGEPLARQRGEQLVLPVAGDARRCRGSRRRAPRAKRRSSRIAMRVVRHRARGRAPTRRGCRRARSPAALFTSPISPPTIMRASEPRSRARGSQVATFLPPRRMVAVSHSALHLLELVADVEDRAAFRLQAAPARRKAGRPPAASAPRSAHRESAASGPASGQRTISMRWRSPTESRQTSRLGLERQARSARDLGDAAAETLANGSLGGSPSATFSATVRFSNSEKCWNTMPMPSARACAGPAERPSCAEPAQLAVVRLNQPVDHLHQVDLPAPFSPSRAWISAGCRSRSMRSLATKVP